MTPNTNNPDEILIEHREQSAEEFTKKHFPGLEKETWFPVIVAIAEGYAKLFKYDFSKSCECVYSPGETWCCNLCGYPVDNSSPNSQVTKLQSQLHAKSEECERLRKYARHYEDCNKIDQHLVLNTNVYNIPEQEYEMLRTECTCGLTNLLTK